MAVGLARLAVTAHPVGVDMLHQPVAEGHRHQAGLRCLVGQTALSTEPPADLDRSASLVPAARRPGVFP